MLIHKNDNYFSVFPYILTLISGSFTTNIPYFYHSKTYKSRKAGNILFTHSLLLIYSLPAIYF
ncbi:hypothetical protein BRYFOR_07423 [Marvinbryantia formatexigens DSM 14469]|uniref:Uncharacterized protein n=1 Tax=Marvinbryantia formatexigens DSM 14469 TaxID=478749 RepID=C6LFM0_9FIRM|nr:hypothetical protein BRYFOR_07423 [Marvinbryantia formatexigens DSM 14469]